MTNTIVILYKEVGKNAVLKKVQNDLKIFKSLIGDELDYIPYEDILIIARKNRKNLRPNIYINTKFLSIGESIRGNVVISCKENENFKSLNEQQAIKYQDFLKRASFNYDNLDKNGRLILKNKNNYFKNGNQLNFDSEIGNAYITTSNNSSQLNIENAETLKMILGIQSVILKFIKNNKG